MRRPLIVERTTTIPRLFCVKEHGRIMTQKRKIMESKKLMLALASFILATSCSNKDSEIMPQVGETVDFTASMKTVSRATETTFEEGDKIGVYAVNAQANTASILQPSGNYADNVRYTYNNGKFINAQGIVRPTDSGLRYYAIYPYTTPCGPTFKFNVKTNQNASGQYTLSDLCTAVSDITSNKEVDLVFSHRLSHVVVNLQGELLGTGTATVRLNNVNTGCDADLNANTFTAYESRNTVYCADNGTNSYKAIIAPQTIEDGSAFLTVSLNGKEHTLKASSDIRLTSGKQQVFNLTIEKDEIVSFTGEILPWGENEQETQKVGIYSLEDLVAFRDARNAGEDVSRWKNEKGEINIYADIDMSSIENWEPISEIESNEILDGLGHKLSGLSISLDNGTPHSAVGLIAKTYGIIKNLHLREGHIKIIKVNDETTVDCVGSITGTGYHFKIVNCSSQVNIEVESVRYGTGGICGTSYGGHIDGCENMGNIVGKGGNCGITGQLLVDTKILNCVNYGNIEGTNWATGIGRDGNTEAVIKGCKNYGKITGTGDCAGIGYAMIIANCINEGEIVGNRRYDSWTGGIALFINDKDMIIDCVNKGAVTGGEHCGGIVGKIYEDFVGTYSNNINAGTVNGVAGSEINAIGKDYR